MLRTLALVLAVTILTPVARAQDLFEGMPAPALRIAKWVKGEPVKFEKGKVYVIDFWATWGGGHAFSLPHLSELQDHYKGKVTIIGVARKDERGNTLEAVEKMVADRGAGMGYTVAWDDEGKTWEAYMTAAAQTRLPVCFLIDKRGQIAFIGPPGQLDIPIARVLRGKWDPLGGGELMARINQKVNTARLVGQTEPENGLKLVDKLLAENPELKLTLDGIRMQLLLRVGDFDAYYGQAGEAVDKAIRYRNPRDLNEIAWTIVDPDGKIGKRDLDLALKAAEKAVEFTRSRDAAILDTLARVWFRKGDPQKAIELQTQAVAQAERAVEEAKKGGHGNTIANAEQTLDALKKVVDEYKAAAAKKAGDGG